MLIQVRGTNRIPGRMDRWLTEMATSDSVVGDRAVDVSVGARRLVGVRDRLMAHKATWRRAGDSVSVSDVKMGYTLPHGGAEEEIRRSKGGERERPTGSASGVIGLTPFC